MIRNWVLLAVGPAIFLAACSKPAPVETTQQKPAPSPVPRIYVSDEVAGDMSIIDSSTFAVSNIHLGKRARGIHPTHDGKMIYVALSGSPIGGPGVDESTLPPPDKSADGIAEFDIAQNKVVRTLESGSDPENFAIQPDDKTIYVSNEDANGVSFLDIPSGKLTKTIKTGDEPEGVSVTPDGKFIYSTNEEDGTVSVTDPVAGKLLKQIKVGRRPAMWFLCRMERTPTSTPRTMAQSATWTPSRTSLSNRFRSASRDRSSRWAWRCRAMEANSMSARVGAKRFLSSIPRPISP